jgi:TetR/AcrR family transcriptional repressor of nem operon
MLAIMRVRTGKREELKHQSLGRVLDSAARRIRQDGLGSTSIAAVMADAGLTHGTFYSHFSSKEDLEAAAFGHAITTGRQLWIPPKRGEPWNLRLARLAKRYLTAAHRDDLASSCGFSALASEAAHATPEFRAAYEREFEGSLSAICGDGELDNAHLDDAIALMVVCVGGLSLSRAVADFALSARILRVARRAAVELADATTEEPAR